MSNLLHTTGTAARRIGISPSTLRYYELIGIIYPQRNSVGQRLLTESDIEAVRAYREQRAAA